MVSLYPTLVSDCTPMLDTVCATTLCVRHFVLQPCVRHTLYSNPVRDTLCTSILCETLCTLLLCQTQFVLLLLCKTITPVPDSLCTAPVSDTVLCPCVRRTLRQRWCVFHPSDRHSPQCHTVCALPLCHTQFVPCSCVRHCALPLCQTHFASETVCIPPL